MTITMKLLLIDDEEETRKGIENYTNWSKLGIDHIVSFSDPFAALAYIENEQIDIVLSDIRIPRMDGITLCQNVLKINPSIKIIFISGYSDKEYLMSAIRMSAVDFVEKPISIPKLEAAIEKAADQLRHVRTQKQQTEEAIEILSKNKQLYTDQLISALIRGQWTLTAPDFFPLNDSDFYRVYLWKIHSIIPDIQAKVQSIARQLSDTGMLTSYICSQKDEKSILMIVRFSSPLECFSQKIDQFLLHALHRENLKHAASCAYGSLIQGFRNIYESYNQAVIALQSYFFCGPGNILPYQNTCQSHNVSHIKTEYPILSLTPLLKGLRSQNKDKCTTFINQIYATYQNQTTLLPDMIRNEYYKIISAIDQIAIELTDINWQSDKHQTKYLWQRINSLETLEECHRCAIEETELFFQNINCIASNRKIILDVMQIVQNHYNDPELYIRQIAQQVYMTPNYLSTLFKKEVGKTIGNYITEIRLEQSARLLTETNMKLYDISKAVGYTDTNYYSKLFKKHYYMTPAEYRNRISGGIHEI